MRDRNILFINTFAGYIRVLIKIIIGLISVRITFHYLNVQEYGFLALLWNIFGYSILLDLGMSFSLQKFVPKYLHTKEIEKIRQAINTIFFLFIGAGVLVLISTLVASNYLDILFRFQKNSVGSVFKNSFILFGVVVAINFPLGIFNDVIIGLHKMYIRELTDALIDVCTLIGIAIVAYLDKGLFAMVMVFAAMSLLERIIMMAFAFKFLPGLRISFKYFNRNTVNTVLSFSLYTFILTATHIILSRTPLVMIGILNSVAGITIYQIASRLPEYLNILTMQISAAILPYASKLEAEANEEKTKRLIYSGTKFVMLILIPIACAILFFNKYFLIMWLGKLDPQVFLLVIPMTLNICLMRGYNVSTNTLIMQGGQKKMAMISVMMTVFSIGSGIAALFIWGLPGLAWSFFFSYLIFYLFMMHPEIAKLCKTSSFTLLIKLVKPHLIPTSAVLIFLIICSKLFNPDSLLILAAVSGTAFILYAVLFWLFAMDAEEKKMILPMLEKIKVKTAG